MLVIVTVDIELVIELNCIWGTKELYVFYLLQI